MTRPTSSPLSFLPLSSFFLFLHPLHESSYPTHYVLNQHTNIPELGADLEQIWCEITGLSRCLFVPSQRTRIESLMDGLFFSFLLSLPFIPILPWHLTLSSSCQPQSQSYSLSTSYQTLLVNSHARPGNLFGDCLAARRDNVTKNNVLNNLTRSLSSRLCGRSLTVFDSPIMSYDTKCGLLNTKCTSCCVFLTDRLPQLRSRRFV